MSSSAPDRGCRVRPSVRSPGRVVALVLALPLVLYAWPAALGGRTTMVLVSGNSMEPWYETNDLVMARRQRSYDIGDVVVYRIAPEDAGAGNLVIHRIVGGDGRFGWVTQGLNREHPDSWHPTSDQILGRAVRSAPIGRPLRIAVGLLTAPWLWGLGVAVVGFRLTWAHLGDADDVPGPFEPISPDPT